MSTNEDSLTHDEIWDDSVLIDSWNEALAEYQHYWSLKSQGKMVLEEAVRAATADGGKQADVGQQSSHVKAEQRQNVMARHDLEDGEKEEGNEEQGDDHTPPMNSPRITHEESKKSTEQQHGIPAKAQTSDAATAAANTDVARLQALNGMLMSYYYAGYYTGVYNGLHQQEFGPVQTTRGAEGAKDNPGGSAG